MVRGICKDGCGADFIGFDVVVASGRVTKLTIKELCLKKLLFSVVLLVPVTMTFAQATTPPAVAPATEPAVVLDPNRVVLEAGDVKVTAQEIDTLIEALGPQAQMAAKAEPQKTHRQLAERLIEMKLLAAQAQKAGLDKDRLAAARMQLSREQILAASMADEILKKDFQAHSAEYQQVKARHILIRAKGSQVPAGGKPELTDEQAKAKASELRARIVDKKEDFAGIAKAESDDKGSGANGGELPPFQKGQMVPEFDQVAFTLKPGEVSEPVKTQYGYHLIQVTERQVPTFEEAKAGMPQQKSGQKIEEYVAKLKLENPVKMDETYFGKPSSRPAMPAMPGEPAEGM